MFFVDKYNPKSIDEIYFHKDKFKKLEIMSKDNSIPHIIFYGPTGSGKKTMIKIFLEMIYDKYVHNLVDSEYSVTRSGNSKKPVIIKQSNYHIVINPFNNNFDRYLIQDVVKEYAKKRQLNVFTSKREFKTVLINNIDNLSYYAQTSLRRTMEKFSNGCRFIMWSRSLSKVIEPLRSRCYCFKVDAPTNDEIFKMIYQISVKEKINMDLDDYCNIIVKANRNIKKGLWLLELFESEDTLDTDYDDAIKNIIELLMEGKLQNVLKIRELIYKILITNIDPTKIIKDLLTELINSDDITDDKKSNIINVTAKYENKLHQGRRKIMHIDIFVIALLQIMFI